MGYRGSGAVLATAVVIATVATATSAQQTQLSNDEYSSKAKSAAPEALAQGASVLLLEKNGAMTTLQKGTNGFTCMVLPDGSPMCTDEGGMDWMHAMLTHAEPPNRVGFMYMLAGDNGTSNTEPFSTDTGPTSSNHWIKTGPHVMVLGPAVRAMAGYPRGPDPDPTKPYVMWPGTPYEHLMLPVK